MTLILSQMEPGKPEIFASIQGEGASVGTPSTFVRLAICNLACTWCDTAYTWDWSRYDRAAQTLEAADEQVVEWVHALPPRNVVVTGGEPLIQRRALAPVVERLKHDGYRVEVETNGTIAPGELRGLVDQWNVSPKLANSGNEGRRRLVDEVLAGFACDERAFFKFVVQSPEDLGEVESLVARFGAEASRVLLMPEGRTPTELESRATWLAEACAERGYRFTPRLHILLWGDKRGV